MSRLADIKQCLRHGNYRQGLDLASSLLGEEPSSFEGNLFAGKCAFELHQYAEAEKYYKGALSAKPEALQPLKGLSQLYSSTSNHEKLADTQESLLQRDPALVNLGPARRDAQLDLARSLLAAKKAARARDVLNELRAHVPPISERGSGADPDHHEHDEEVDCLLADCQLELDSAEYEQRVADALSRVSSRNGEEVDAFAAAKVRADVAASWAEEQMTRAEDNVRSLTDRTRPSPRNMKYYVETLERKIAAIGGAVAGSEGRHERRVAALQTSLALIEGQACTSPVPFEYALRLMEVEEEVASHADSSAGPDRHSMAAAAQAMALNKQASQAHHHDLSASLHERGQRRRTGVFELESVASFAESMLDAGPVLARHTSNIDRLMAGVALKAESDADDVDECAALSASSRRTTGGGERVHDRMAAIAASSLRSSIIGASPGAGIGGQVGGPSLLSRAIAAVDEGDEPDSSVQSATGEESSLGSVAPTAPSSGPIQLVRYASRTDRSSNTGQVSEVIPVVGSYELRALSRGAQGPEPSPLRSELSASPSRPGILSRSLHGAAHSHSHGGAHVTFADKASVASSAVDTYLSESPFGMSGVYQPPPRHVRLGTATTMRRAVSEDSGGLADHPSINSNASVAGSATSRTLLPSLSSVPRISRDDVMSHMGATPQTLAPGSPLASTSPVTSQQLPPLRASISSHAGVTASMPGSFMPSYAPSIAPSRRSMSQWSVHVPEDERPMVGQLGMVEDMERIASKLLHMFPNNDAGQAHLAMALHRRAPMLEQSAMQLQRPRVIATLRRAMSRGVPSAAGWLCLSEAYSRDGKPADALWAAKQGLAYVNMRARMSKEHMTQAGLALRLEAAQALLALGRLDEAESAYSLLKEWTSEGEITFPYVAGIMPVSIRQQATRGLAQVALSRGNRASAKRQYEKILGRALRGYGPSEPWAHAEYAWLAFEDGDTKTAHVHLKMALEVAELADALVPPHDLASYNYRMGRVLWAEHKATAQPEDLEAIYVHFLSAAAADGPDQAEAFAYLGHFLRDVRLEELKARKCYRRSLEIDPLCAAAGNALCDLLHASNSEALVGDVCREILALAPRAEWARARLGLHYLRIGKHERAIQELQAALRIDAERAATWEALGAAYEGIGRLAAALKAYERAVQLDASRVYALTQGAAISCMLGDTQHALELLGIAEEAAPEHPAVLLGQCHTLQQVAILHAAVGASVLAAESIGAAVAAARRATTLHGRIEAGWKALGDSLIRATALPAPSQPRAADLTAQAPDDTVKTLLSAARQRTRSAAEAQRAYAVAVHLNPCRAAAWSDLAMARHQIAALNHAHPALYDRAEAQRAAAQSERMLLGALKLAPHVAGFWSALGSVQTAPAQREYALRRAIQLDGSDAVPWLKLGRLYHSQKLPERVKECYDAARASDPKLAAIWEAMACFEAMADPDAPADPSRVAEATVLYKHALGLNGGPDAALGYAAAALLEPEPPAAMLQAAATRAQAVQPLNPAIYHVLGLSLEAVGAVGQAATMLRLASELYQEGSAASCSSEGPLLLPSPGTRDVKTGIALDIARITLKSGDRDAAAEQYAALDTSGSLTRSDDLLCAAAAASDAAASVGYAWRAVESADSDAQRAAAASGAVRLAVSRATLQAAWSLQGRALGVLKDCEETRVALAAMLVTIAGAAAAAGSSLDHMQAREQLLCLFQGTSGVAGNVAPECLADLRVSDATFAAAESPRRAALQCMHAVHAAPWSLAHRSVALETRARCSNETSEAPVSRLLPSAAVLAEPRRVANAGELAASLTLCHAPPGCLTESATCSVASVARDALRSVHAHPAQSRAWYSAAMALTQAAVTRGTSTRRAVAAVAQACSLCGDDGSIRSRLLIAHSMLLLVEGSHDEAADVAQQALRATPSDPSALRQVARCHVAVGDIAAAEVALRDGASSGHMASALMLVQLLTSIGRAEDAVKVLFEAKPAPDQAPEGAPPQSACGTPVWMAALKTAHIGVLVALDDLESARTAVSEDSGGSSGAHAAARACLLAVGGVQAASRDDRSATRLLSEARKHLREAGVFSSREDIAAVHAVTLCAAEASRGRTDDAAACLLGAQHVLNQAGLHIPQGCLVTSLHLSKGVS